MGIEDLIAQYQKKIGTHDKQQWERTIEQRIFHGLNNIQLRSAKPKNDLIDLDLVRGSSFTKAKPTYGFLTVTKLATLRIVFLPLYSKWWVTQTSRKIFAILLMLYLMQLFNLGVYSYNTSNSNSEVFENVPSKEIIVPMIMMWILSYIHTQIVSTNPGPECPRPSMKPRKNYRRKRRSRKVVFQDDPNIVSSGNITNGSTTKLPPDIKDGNTKATLNAPVRRRPSTSHKPLDDDGFESFNGNGSSRSDNDDDLPLPSDSVNRLLLAPKHTKKRTEFLISTRDHPHNFLNDTNPVRTCSDGNVIYRHSRQTTTTTSLNPSSIYTGEMTSVSDSVSGGGGGVYMSRWLKQLPPVRGVTGGGRGLSRRLSAPELQFSSGEVDSDSDTCVGGKGMLGQEIKSPLTRRHSQYPLIRSPTSIPSTCDDSDEDECECETLSSPEETLELLNPILPSTAGSTAGSCSGSTTGNVTSNPSTTDPVAVVVGGSNVATEWLAGGTTNSEDCCSYSSDLEESDQPEVMTMAGGVGCDVDSAPTAILTSCVTPSDRVSCTIWDRRDMKKAELSVLDISSAIIARVETMPESRDYFYIGMTFATVLSVLPIICRLCNATLDQLDTTDTHLTAFELTTLIIEKWSKSMGNLLDEALGSTIWERCVMILAALERFTLGTFLFFLLAVAERTFKQRFLYAKLFSHLTSSRRARKSDLPHFRLNKVRNIKTWLSVRSYLKKRGPQRSVDVIVSAAFVTTLLLLAFLSMELLKDSVALHSQYNLEALIWILGLGIVLLRFMTLGTKINKKYRNLSVLITEQINLYLQIELKPHKKEELMVANSVLKLAADLLKELESPFKISGLSANSYLYNITKVVILSALSGVLSEMLGFKLKLHKIKIK